METKNLKRQVAYFMLSFEIIFFDKKYNFKLQGP